MTKPGLKDLLHLTVLKEEDLQYIDLMTGQHRRRSDGVCATEAAAWMAGEPHTDAPKSICSTLASIFRDWNDRLELPDRNRILKPMLPQLLRSNRGPEAARNRSVLISDWIIHEHIPMWLDLSGLTQSARILRGLPQVTPNITTDQATDVRRALLGANMETARQLDRDKPKTTALKQDAHLMPDLVRRSGYWSLAHAAAPLNLTRLYSPNTAAEAAYHAGADLTKAEQNFQTSISELVSTLVAKP